MSEAQRGLIVMGVSRTALFTGETSTELLLLDMSTGEDFMLPVNDFQAEVVLSRMGEEGSPAPEEEVVQASDQIKAILGADAPTGVDQTPQL